MVDVEVRLGARSSAEVSPGIFGGFVEHFGGSMYGGIWDTARGHVRTDVLSAVRGMRPTALRYPGGCFADWYHWRDGVGPPDERPTHERQFWTGFQVRDGEPAPALAERFGPVETNAFGTDEFLRYCNDVGAEPLLTANFGTGTPEEAAEWVAYTNRRAESGRPVRRWFVGNETYGPWELGHCSGTEYGTRLRDFAEAMRAVDPGIELIAVGDRPRQGWNPDMLAAAGDAVDMVSLHFYYPGYALGRDLNDDANDFHQLLRGALHFGQVIDETIAEIDAARDGGAPLPLTLDEWGMWTSWPDLLAANHRLCDSVFYGASFNRMIERADRVRYAMISHLVNAMAPIQTSGDRMFTTAAYLTFLLYRASVRRHPVAVEVDAPTVGVTPFLAQSGDRPLGGTMGVAWDVPVADAAATADDHATSVHVCASSLEPVRTTIDGLPRSVRGRARWLDGPDPFARNDFEAPTRIGFGQSACETDARGRCTVELRPATVTVITFDHEESA
jgi:alpha-N-arabinofuranosidase